MKYLFHITPLLHHAIQLWGKEMNYFILVRNINTMTAEAYARIREAAPAAGLLAGQAKL